MADELASSKIAEAAIVTDPVESAKIAGLRYVSDRGPGIRRERSGRGFRYYDASGGRIRNRRELQRLKSLAIPPAWTDVWICPSPRGHIQATGRDEKGRKQYRYHPDWRQVRDEAKYGRMIAFGEALPGLRSRVDEDLAQSGLTRSRVLATVVMLLGTTFVRVGNEEYAQANKSFGLTTLRTRHVKIEGSTIRFRFKGKSGKQHLITLTDPRLARIVRRCQELPGQDLFQYVDDEGCRAAIDSTGVNDYLREVTGEDFTAKDFRTWAGTVLAARYLAEIGPANSATEARHNIVTAIKQVAERLGNTPAICRKSYVHPDVLEAYTDGSLFAFMTPEALSASEAKNPYSLGPDEEAVLKLLKQRLRESIEESRDLERAS